MKNSKIRKAIILISFLLFPITIYYFSPYLIAMGASEHVINGSFIVFSLMFLTSLVFGRGFCGWVCPVGGLQECLFAVNDRRAKGGWRNIIKYFIWGPMILITAILLLVGSSTIVVNFFYQTETVYSLRDIGSYVIYYSVLLLVVILSLTSGKRGFCHYACWMAPFMIIGSKLANLLHIPGLKLQAESAGCTDCMKCNKVCPMSLDVNGAVQKGDMNNVECILCGECANNCPSKVINLKFKKS